VVSFNEYGHNGNSFINFKKKNIYQEINKALLHLILWKTTIFRISGQWLSQ